MARHRLLLARQILDALRFWHKRSVPLSLQHSRSPRIHAPVTKLVLDRIRWNKPQARPAGTEKYHELARSGRPPTGEGIGRMAKAPGCERFRSRDYRKQRMSAQITLTRAALEGMPLVTVWKSYIPAGMAGRSKWV